MLGNLIIGAVLFAIGAIIVAYFVSRPEPANEDVESAKDADI